MISIPISNIIFSLFVIPTTLLNIPVDMPYRGPRYYKQGNYIYKCTVEGNFEWFSGYEEIFNGDTKVYECMFHAEMVK